MGYNVDAQIKEL